MTMKASIQKVAVIIAPNPIYQTTRLFLTTGKAFLVGGSHIALSGLVKGRNADSSNSAVLHHDILRHILYFPA